MSLSSHSPDRPARSRLALGRRRSRTLTPSGEARKLKHKPEENNSLKVVHGSDTGVVKQRPRRTAATLPVVAVAVAACDWAISGLVAHASADLVLPPGKACVVAAT
eukprot:CAMPEP_0171801842 /NCGR_PEP_ID=MMETSP0991-20121206/72467_1 /TAXON_ID=483369 /ORGANISM="non described non described, Strain CCMP2098" /LENGTH=105 /DNA_ID=CAMNT_0012413523 /DNA_START=524 /DNA_END=842 /DNA_ORIENTATION=-